MPGHEPLGDGRQQALTQQVDEGAVRVGVQGWGVGQVVGVEGAVGGVEVDGHMGVVQPVESGQGPGLGTVELDVVAVEVLPPGIGALAHAPIGTVLPGAATRADALIAVGIVHGGDEEHGGASPLRVASLSQIAGQFQQGLLAAHLAGVDVALQIDPQPAGGPHRLG